MVSFNFLDVLSSDWKVELISNWSGKSWLDVAASTHIMLIGLNSSSSLRLLPAFGPFSATSGARVYNLVLQNRLVLVRHEPPFANNIIVLVLHGWSRPIQYLDRISRTKLSLVGLWLGLCPQHLCLAILLPSCRIFSIFSFIMTIKTKIH